MKVFQEFHPMGGVRARPLEAPAGAGDPPQLSRANPRIDKRRMNEMIGEDLWIKSSLATGQDYKAKLTHQGYALVHVNFLFLSFKGTN
jgi:hypothetical protein